MRLCLVVFFSALLPLVVSMKCWSGWQIWEHGINNVTKQNCLPNQNCCYMIASAMSGTNYGCYDQCPASNVEKCGPDPKLGIQDIRYCYCRDHSDKDCQPYLGEN